jgi:predicted Rossmann fold nucleotide-binding protein DprA/Smf involved in DNA uptake
VTDFLDEKRREITTRLTELKPLVEEYQRLQAAATALEGVRTATSHSSASNGRRGPGRPRGSTSKKRVPVSVTASRGGARRRAGRRKGSGTRAAQALTFVQGQPGITIAELAGRMGIKQNYLYRVLPTLEQEGKVSRRGRGWHAKG